MVLEVLVIFVVTWAVLTYLQSGMKKENEPPPVRFELPIIRHTHRILKARDGRDWWNLWLETADDCWEKGGVLSINTIFPQFTHIVIGNPDDLLIVANSTMKHYFYKAFHQHFGRHGLVVATGNVWKNHRKQINLAFTPKFLNTVLIDLFNGCGRSLCSTWASKVGKPFEHMQTISEAALEAVLGDIGKECNVSIKDYVEAVACLDRSLALRLGNLFLHLDLIYFLTKDGREHIAKADYVSKEGRKLIEATRKKMRTNPDGTKEIPEIKTIVDFLVFMTDFNDEDLLDEVNTFLAGGHNTTASSLTSFFVILGSYPEVQEKLYKELVSVYGTSDRDVTKEDFASLPYLEAVIKEAMRLYPAVPIVMRYSKKKLALTNYTIPGNRFYLMNIYASNRHPVWGPDRMEFKPERWLDRDKLPPQHAFASFSLGKRSCIGKRYAMYAMKTIVTHILRRYKVIADINKFEVELAFLMKPISGGVITLEERNPDLATNEQKE
ncbi:cytochrome P450 4V2 [Amyelois transitella]|uniref:cytochrome P450 4V2 n=1 Tax=Amyelois transitella TaxID=680683 RepID=UPI00067BC003|nr:cytochrome P450 4V2 [Amyelois transitella]